ncbi:cryptochrome/photolyase family protein [Rhizobium rosettiformans]|uniref:cryptochrome/photolyase family protein n=1 Tax=Rhizobium rosettiformans TaxID=1368430 RepID=UPI00285EEEE8|nr:cryptochrome/photolyase family protein [Rhizobium rosettiformans]MDR7030198.1 deoxyribodipyrimidine photolyase-related protein [Rhizobium rosettiformans]MDR7065821.1 deoxyribodipyrimidine photolyase-related protein [Rhizobium rosettiformans]
MVKANRIHLVLGDQLSHSLSALADADPQDSLVLMAEVMSEASYVKHHKKKIAFLFSAMRHFAEELREKGVQVRYVTLDDPENTQSLRGELARAIAESGASSIVATECGEWRLAEEMRGWETHLGVPVEIREDHRFLCSIEDFRQWRKGRKQLRMEYFYRDMRRRHRVLLEGEEPVGGKWNFDAENRKPPAEGLKGPRRISHRKDDITTDVLALVEERFAENMGSLDSFHYAVTSDQAEMELQQFIDEILPNFGDYQDAMVKGEPYLYHSLISSYVNAGLLLPIDVIRRAEAAWFEGLAPLNAVEGFIRQILGWREYVRGIYWTEMPDYAQCNHLSAARPLPQMYWTAKTDMVCMKGAIGDTIEHAYSHHIQRLMVTGNFAMLAGIDPAEVCEWYLAVYSDAYEWVELPNTLGMALYGDGGVMASKPYAASGKYIDRMSNFCGGCRYDPKLTTGPRACPFNALYWDFLDRNTEKLARNPRLSNMYATWRRMDPFKQDAIRKHAAQVLDTLDAL